MLDYYQPLHDMNATFEFSNKNLNRNNIDHHGVPYNQVTLTTNGIRFHHYELGKAKLYYNTPLKAVDHDDKVNDEMSSIFQTPRFQSAEANTIIVCAAARPITKVLITLYTTYHSTLSDLFLSWFEQTDLVKLIVLFDLM
jgi:hypothetical protein